MSDRCETIKVKPWGKDQGEFVLINADDFDPAVHSKFGEKAAAMVVGEQGAEVFDPRPAPKRAAKRKGK